MYDDEAGGESGSGDSEDSDLDDQEEGGELQKELLSRTERGPLGQLQPQGGMGMYRSGKHGNPISYKFCVCLGQLQSQRYTLKYARICHVVLNNKDIFLANIFCRFDFLIRSNRNNVYAALQIFLDYGQIWLNSWVNIHA